MNDEDVPGEMQNLCTKVRHRREEVCLLLPLLPLLLLWHPHPCLPPPPPLPFVFSPLSLHPLSWVCTRRITWGPSTLSFVLSVYSLDWEDAWSPG